MSQQGRDKSGKFSFKSDEGRQVRSIRLTDAAWDALGNLANERSITRADLIEEWMSGEYFNLLHRVHELELELQSAKNNSIHVSDLILQTIDKLSIKRSITREEVISQLVQSSTISQVELPITKPVIHTQLALLHSDSNRGDEKILDETFRDELLNKLKSNPLPGELLADRLKINSSYLSAKRAKSSHQEFSNWLQAKKDPDDIRWISLSIGRSRSKGFVPLDDTPLEKLQSLEKWLNIHRSNN